MCHNNYKLLEIQYGKITGVSFKNYYKYIFTLVITTDKYFVITIQVGGDRDNIYKYEPISLDWGEHTSTGILELTVDVEGKDLDGN